MQVDPIRAAELAGHLLKIQAVKLSPEAPFTWASGWLSPIYCDNRKTLSVPAVRDFIKMAFSDAIRSLEEQPDMIAGVATGGIAIGALVADVLELPYVYVRASAKGHGLGNLIEGGSVENKKVLVIEDLISTGKSSLTAVAALREAGANVLQMLSIFTYGFDIAEQAIEDADLNFSAMTDLSSLLAVAEKEGLISEEMNATIERWREDPAKWGKMTMI